VRLLFGLAALLVVAGCGSVAGRTGAPAAPSAPLAEAPPIQAVNEAPSEELQRSLNLEFAPAELGTQTATFSSGVDVWVALGAGGPSTTSTVPTAAQMATIQAQFEAQRAARLPAAGSPPRVVARLPLADGGNALLVAWHNEDGVLCTDTEVSDSQGSGGGGPGSSCVPAELAASPLLHCAQICLDSNGSGSDLAHEVWVLSGTVAADADALDVTTADGTAAEYPLTGPLLDGGTRRAFLLELGASDWRKLVLLRAGEVVDRTELPAAAAANEDCMAKVGAMPAPPTPYTPGPIPSSPAMDAWNASLQACMTASGALPAFPAPTP
jgi:hypothetical protein